MGLKFLPCASIESFRIFYTFGSRALYGRISICAKIELEPVDYMFRLVFSLLWCY